jgi:hypothetical protein
MAPQDAAISEDNQPFYKLAGIDFRNLIWVFAVFAVLIWAINAPNDWVLRYIHIVTGVLSTGADIFLGFLVGPIIRRMSFESRRQFSLYMMPKTLFIMNTLGVCAPTSGWFMAVQFGYLDLAYPAFWWVIAALAVSAVLAVQGLGVLLPANLCVYLEMRKPNPDVDKVARLMRRYFYVLATQGLMQVCIVIIMVHFAARF